MGDKIDNLIASLDKEIDLGAQTLIPMMGASLDKEIPLVASLDKEINLLASVGSGFVPAPGLWVVDKDGKQVVDYNGKKIYV